MCRLQHRCKDHRFWLIPCALILRILYHADNLEVARILNVNHAKVLPNRLFTMLEEFLDKRLVDHCDARRCRSICGCKGASPKDLLADCFEVLRTRPIEKSICILSGIRRALTLDIRIEAPAVSTERRVECQSNMLHPRHRMKLVFYLLVQPLQP